MPGHYEQLIAKRREAMTLASVGTILGWDQETFMPEAGVTCRAEQNSLIARLVHERMTCGEMGDLIGECETDSGLTADEQIAANLREIRRDYDLATCLPTDLVAEISGASSQALQAWKQARAAADFKQFEPWLEKMVTLARRKAERYGWPDSGEAYDALLNEYEPGATAAQIESVFTPLAERLSGLVKELAENGTAPSDAPLGINVEATRQHKFGLFVIEKLGFDLGAGRLDTVTHPFCEGIGAGDTRLTTRYRENHFTDALYGTMHEAGHGLYEQGLPKAECFGQPLGESISLGIHESQSRMWENFVGRSRAFWRWALPHAKDMLGPALDPFDVDDLFSATNISRPSFIRVEADESTYNLHIMLRFEVERKLISGELAVKDVPGVWNENFQRLLGASAPDDASGCLQDVHWSMGALGYFPTYCLGNLYAAQFWETINEQIPDLDERMARGDFTALLDWLRANIHRHGRRYRAGELCERITGKALSADPLMRHLERKFRPVYGL